MTGSTNPTTDGSHRCHYCGGYHDTLCPRVAEIEYFPNGLVKRVRFAGDVTQPVRTPTVTGMAEPVGNTSTVVGIDPSVPWSFT